MLPTAPDERRFDRVDQVDLEEFRAHAVEELERFLTKAGTPPGKFHVYRNRLILMCLAQGTAQHIIDLEPAFQPDQEIELPTGVVREKGHRVSSDGQVVAGIKDIDIFMFFTEETSCRIPDRRHCRKSTVVHLTRLGLRRFDFMKKGIPESPQHVVANPEAVLRRYLTSTEHGRSHLAKESVVGLHPDEIFAKPLWIVRRLTRFAAVGSR